MASVRVPPHPPFDADLPVRLILSPAQALAPDLERRVTAAADLFCRFAHGGAFPEVKAGTAARVSLAGRWANQMTARPAVERMMEKIG
jgi:hypothetical protein